MRTDLVKKSLENFAKEVIRQARTNLTKQGKNTSKTLYKSLQFDVNVSPSSFSLSIQMEDYGTYQDKGVSGTEVKYSTPFSFKSKMPPAKKLSEWAKMKGLRFRDKKGRFISNKQTGYILANNIFKNGIKPSLFFTKPFERAFDRLPEQIINDFGLTVERFLENTLNN
jgi:hypothetical protein